MPLRHDTRAPAKSGLQESEWTKVRRNVASSAAPRAADRKHLVPYGGRPSAEDRRLRSSAPARFWIFGGLLRPRFAQGRGAARADRSDQHEGAQGHQSTHQGPRTVDEQVPGIGRTACGQRPLGRFDGQRQHRAEEQSSGPGTEREERHDPDRYEQQRVEGALLKGQPVSMSPRALFLDSAGVCFL